MSHENDISQSSVGRRDFFRKLLMHGIDKLQDVGKQIQDRARIFEPPPAPTPAYTPATYEPPPRYLRPPGALPELEFLDACSRCGKCVEACPADCIVIEKDKAGGRPFIKARAAPCVVCDDLSCMKVCPTGALKLVEDRAQIRMGYATVDHWRCLRGESGEYDHETGQVKISGEDCRVCIAQCPFGEDAIGVDQYHGTIEVREGCTGCGVCERACPTEPASIWVEPHDHVIDFPWYGDD
jgi:ferredoxin-type protein NapG